MGFSMLPGTIRSAFLNATGSPQSGGAVPFTGMIPPSIPPQAQPPRYTTLPVPRPPIAGGLGGSYKFPSIGSPPTTIPGMDRYNAFLQQRAQAQALRNMPSSGGTPPAPATSMLGRGC